jgi:hypothetical protein
MSDDRHCPKGHTLDSYSDWCEDCAEATGDLRDRCEAEGWNDGTEYVCDLPPGHDGKHIDVQEGWEW